MSNTTPRAPTHTAIQVPSIAALFDTAHCASCHRFTLYRRTQVHACRVYVILARARARARIPSRRCRSLQFALSFSREPSFHGLGIRADSARIENCIIMRAVARDNETGDSVKPPCANLAAGAVTVSMRMRVSGRESRLTRTSRDVSRVSRSVVFVTGKQRRKLVGRSESESEMKHLRGLKARDRKI